MSKCNECQRELPNKSFITKNGCLWCDYSYYVSEQEEKRISAIYKILNYELQIKKNKS